MKDPVLKKKPFFLWLCLIFLNLIFIFLVLAAPVIRHRSPQLSLAIYAAYAPFCHQIKERCFALAGEPLAICARCFGIMTGFFLSLILYPLIRKLTCPEPFSPSLLIGVSFPMAVDLFGNGLHFWSSPNWLRFLIGSGWGFSLPFYFWPAAISLWLTKTSRKKYEIKKKDDQSAKTRFLNQN